MQAASDGSVEVLSADEASGGEEDVLDSANDGRQYHKGVSLCLTSPLQMMRTLTNTRHA